MISIEEQFRSVECLPEEKRSRFTTVSNGHIADTLNSILQSRNNEDNRVLLICGSFKLMIEVEDYFDMGYECDPVDLNERY